MFKFLVIVFTKLNDVKLISKGARNPPDCAILDSWVFDNFMLAYELFAKVLQSLETCVSVNNNLCGKLVSLLVSQITLHERFKAIPDFNLLTFELDNFTFKV